MVPSKSIGMLAAWAAVLCSRCSFLNSSTHLPQLSKVARLVTSNTTTPTAALSLPTRCTQHARTQGPVKHKRNHDHHDHSRLSSASSFFSLYRGSSRGRWECSPGLGALLAEDVLAARVEDVQLNDRLRVWHAHGTYRKFHSTLHLVGFVEAPAWQCPNHNNNNHNSNSNNLVFQRQRLGTCEDAAERPLLTGAPLLWNICVSADLPTVASPAAHASNFSTEFACSSSGTLTKQRHLAAQDDAHCATTPTPPAAPLPPPPPPLLLCKLHHPRTTAQVHAKQHTHAHLRTPRCPYEDFDFVHLRSCPCP